MTKRGNEFCYFLTISVIPDMLSITSENKNGASLRPRRVTANIAELVADGGERQAGSIVRDCGVGVVKTHDVIFGSAETLYTAGTRGSRMRLNEVGQRGVSNGGESVAALRSRSHRQSPIESQ